MKKQNFTGGHIWTLFKRGEETAFEQIYFQHVDMLYDYGTRLTRDEGMVEDCIQDLFADLWEKKDRLDEVKSIKYYLLVALKRRLLRKLSSQKEVLLQQQEPTYYFEVLLSSEALKRSSFISEERMQQLQEAFSHLTPKQQEALYLRFYNKLSFEEIAEIMAVQVRAVYKLVARAIHLLKERLTSTFPMLLILASFLSIF